MPAANQNEFAFAVFPTALESATASFAESSKGTRGAIFTKRSYVEFILDLLGYTPDKPLVKQALLEPACGEGSFLCVAVQRLLASLRNRRKVALDGDLLKPAIRAVELHADSLAKTRAHLSTLLLGAGFTAADAGEILKIWLVQKDFLLTDFSQSFDYVVGNPPYVRQELIPPVLLAEYRRRFRSVFDRADLYVPFIEKSLGHLASSGALGFICADRWMKNRYGGPLRALVAQDFRLKFYAGMTDVPAFEQAVIAYPAITVIARESPGTTRVVQQIPASSVALKQLGEALITPGPVSHPAISELACVPNGEHPWILHETDRLALVRRFEAVLPTIEEAGCRVGIGVATGADRAFVGKDDELDVEEDRKVPLVMTSDIRSGEVVWQGRSVLNPFDDDGGLVSLSKYPRLAKHLTQHEMVIRARNVARRNPTRWFRTIDRIYPDLASQEKLLIPDIKGAAHIVHERGKFYPHHNLYYVTSDEWDLRALRAVLLSGIAQLFVAAYCTKMHGGFLRFQAQYLRRIRLPRWHDIPAGMRQHLIAASSENKIAKCSQVVAELYGLGPTECTKFLSVA